MDMFNPAGVTFRPHTEQAFFMGVNQDVRIVLASQSPRRIDLLSNLGVSFECIPSHIDEITDKTDPAEVVLDLSFSKASSVLQDLRNKDAINGQRTLILGADTIVVLGREIIGKPTSREDAYQMLTRMSGRPHRVFTGVTIIDANADSVWRDYEVSDVFFRYLDSAEIRNYVKTSEPMDKAGSYALQGMASCFVEKIQGCYTNIIGLPVPLTVKMLRQAGISILGLP